MGKIYEPNFKDILSILNLKDFKRTNHVISYDVEAKKISSATNFISQNNSVSFMTFICQDLKGLTRRICSSVGNVRPVKLGMFQ